MKKFVNSHDVDICFCLAIIVWISTITDSNFNIFKIIGLTVCSAWILLKISLYVIKKNQF